jgi:hypothetical protein
MEFMRGLTHQLGVEAVGDGVPQLRPLSLCDDVGRADSAQTAATRPSPTDSARVLSPQSIERPGDSPLALNRAFLYSAPMSPAAQEQLFAR